jgi:hypothetical protein
VVTKAWREALAQASRRQMLKAVPSLRTPRQTAAEAARARKAKDQADRERGHAREKARPQPQAKASRHPLLAPDHATERVEICPVGMAVIYALVDPRDGTVRYVGKSTQPGDRLDQHISRPHKNRKLRSWIRTLNKKRERPEFHAIDLVALADWPEAERKWIAFYRERGVIFNIEDGGISPHASRGGRPPRSRTAGPKPSGLVGPRAADVELAQPEVGIPVPLPATARDDVQRFADASQGAINLRGAAPDARDWGTGTQAEPHSWTRDASDPPPSHREPTAGVTEGPHVRSAGVTSASGLSPAEQSGETPGADPST